MVVSVLVLEETLWIKSFPVDKEFEFVNYVLNVLVIGLIWDCSSIEGLGSSIIKYDVNRLFKAFLSEYLIYTIRELSP